MENQNNNVPETVKNETEKKDIKENQSLPKSAGNRRFRKHNKLGFYRFMRKKRRIKKQG